MSSFVDQNYNRVTDIIVINYETYITYSHEYLIYYLTTSYKCSFYYLEFKESNNCLQAN